MKSRGNRIEENKGKNERTLNKKGEEEQVKRMKGRGRDNAGDDH